jgi:hypothetical protein
MLQAQGDEGEARDAQCGHGLHGEVHNHGQPSQVELLHQNVTIGVELQQVRGGGERGQDSKGKKGATPVRSGGSISAAGLIKLLLDYVARRCARERRAWHVACR